MLKGIDPLLTGELLMYLDRMGHSDALVVADAHFPAWVLGAHVVEVPGVSSPDMLRAICSVVPLDDEPALDLMEAADGGVLGVQRDLMAAAGVGARSTRFVERFAYYELAAKAFLVVRTGEARKYGNALLRKGVVGHSGS